MRLMACAGIGSFARGMPEAAAARAATPPDAITAPAGAKVSLTKALSISHGPAHFSSPLPPQSGGVETSEARS